MLSMPIKSFIANQNAIMKVLKCLSFICVLLSYPCAAQNNDFNFFIEKIKANYPGFNDKTNSAKFAEFASTILHQNSKDTFRAMSIIVNSFNDRHLRIYQMKESLNFDKKACGKDFLKVKRYLDGKNAKNKYEGYWLNDYNDCVVGLVRETANPTTYKAYVVESNDSLLPKGRIISTFELSADNTFLTDVISTYSKKRYFDYTIFRNDSVFTTGVEGKWKKLCLYKTPILKNLSQFDYNTTARLLDSNTYLIKIPGCTARDGQIIDSLVKTDYEKIANSKTLIIDLTNNLGGNSYVFSPLWPFLYSGPIIKHQTATYCTEDIISQFQQTVDDYEKNGNTDSTALKQTNDWIKVLKENIGQFVLNGADTIKFDTILPIPKNVGVIINYSCQSATELILFMAKQSNKVKLFGEHTMGVADYLDYSPTYSPSKRYKLYIATSKRVITEKGPKIDGIGIYPDVPISDTTQNWQNFVEKYYEEH